MRPIVTAAVRPSSHLCCQNCNPSLPLPRVPRKENDASSGSGHIINQLSSLVISDHSAFSRNKMKITIWRDEVSFHRLLVCLVVKVQCPNISWCRWWLVRCTRRYVARSPTTCLLGIWWWLGWKTAGFGFIALCILTCLALAWVGFGWHCEATDMSFVSAGRYL